MDINQRLSDCLFIDLETGMDKKIYQIGAVFNDLTFERKDKKIESSDLEALDDFGKNARNIIGHNIIHHDLPMIRQKNSQLKLLNLPVIDTLYLSPLAFPQNPYHRLVKDYKLVKDALNNPVKDAKICKKVFTDAYQSFIDLSKSSPVHLQIFAQCFSTTDNNKIDYSGISHFFSLFEKAKNEYSGSIFNKLQTVTEGKVCIEALAEIAEEFLNSGNTLPLAYCVAWLGVSGGNSVLPGWVRNRFPSVTNILNKLRENHCGNEDCKYCQTSNDAQVQLKTYFGFDNFRDNPKADDGSSLQHTIVSTGMDACSILAILPTGGGKSLCYQLPALVHYFRRGFLTVIISPLQALMKDQVDNLSRITGSLSVAAIYGLLTPPERGEILKQVSMGDIAVLYLSPEQLRNQTIQTVLKQREIGCWVFDEAHCLSKWGHDFRPDYLYAARFIKEFSGHQSNSIPPIACFTATAKLDVINEIQEHFKEILNKDLTLFLSSVERTNLDFEVQPVTGALKFEKIRQIIEERLGDKEGTVVVYTNSRKGAERISDYLVEKEMDAQAFHAGLDAARKREILEQFIAEEIRIICATNAFGMGIDKDNVRLVIHADIPGSLENYLQEAGRAGRDLKASKCILLFDSDDLNSQFSLEKRSELTQKDISQILRGLRKSKKDKNNEVVITSGELVRNEDVTVSFETEENMADTKVKTAIAWLEKSGYLERNLNQTWVFSGKPAVSSMDEAIVKIDKLGFSEDKKTIWLSIIEQIFNAGKASALMADQVAESAFTYDPVKPSNSAPVDYSFYSQKLIRTFQEMVKAGLLKTGIQLTAFIQSKGQNNAKKLLTLLCQLENEMIHLMQELDPDSDVGHWVDFHLIKISQRLKENGTENNPETLKLILKSLSLDGKGLAGKSGSILVKLISKERFKLKLQRSWGSLKQTVRRRQVASSIILNHLLTRKPINDPDEKTPLIEFACEELTGVIDQDIELRALIKDKLALVERCLSFLHDQKIITLQSGLAVFRQAMRINLNDDKKGSRYNKSDYKPLEFHYSERIFQIHVMGEYARLGGEMLKQALKMVLDYFEMDKKSFFKKYFKGREAELMNPATPELFKKIVEDLNNPLQQEIVTSNTNQNILILAGPGSGKTKVIIHRCAYLLCVERATAASILILCYNHNAAVELRKRLFELVGKEARWVTIYTYHALAMKIMGRTFSINFNGNESIQDDFKVIIQDAVRLLSGEIEIPGIDADEQRERLLAGYQTILVDEYQDIDEHQYNLVSVIAGRRIAEVDQKMTIMAVGDDDQNIYSFRGSNIRYIKKFQEDYQIEKIGSKKPQSTQKLPIDIRFLTENYRSTKSIIHIANQFITHNRDRMKTNHPICINKIREAGQANQSDLMMIKLNDINHQPEAILEELKRLKAQCDGGKWSDFAILTRTKAISAQIRVVLEQNDIPISWKLDKDKAFPIHRSREIDHFLAYLKTLSGTSITISKLREEYRRLNPQIHQTVWSDLLNEILNIKQAETFNAERPVQYLIDEIYDTLMEMRRENKIGNGVFLGTMHSAKGMEYNHVLIPDGGWAVKPNDPGIEDERRLFYVALTRARKSLSIVSAKNTTNPHIDLLNENDWQVKQAEDMINTTVNCSGFKYEMISLSDIHLGFPGRFTANSQIHLDLLTITPGDIVYLHMKDSDIHIQNKAGRTISKLSKSAFDKWSQRLPNIKKAVIIAMINRTKQDETLDFQKYIRCDKWELPIVEVLTDGFSTKS
jgi:ATP-dependent DNA helicase RecQ